jgi:excisionase family DNA binding protein
MSTEAKPQMKFCTTREAAEMLGVSLKTAQLWSESGLLEAWRTEGGHRRIYRDSVQRLLVESAGAKTPIAEEAEPASARTLSILVAEDDDNLRRLYSMQLRTWSMAPKVMVVPTGFEALLEIGRHAPDLLITDLRMPEIDGFRMLRILRNVEELNQMRIVVVSGLDREEIAANGGVPEDVVVFPKPIPFVALEQLAVSIAANKWATLKESSV